MRANDTDRITDFDDEYDDSIVLGVNAGILGQALQNPGAAYALGDGLKFVFTFSGGDSIVTISEAASGSQYRLVVNDHRLGVEDFAF